MSASPTFETCLILALEMLKRGADEIDMHPWGLRLSKPTERLTAWSVGLIPVAVQEEYEKHLARSSPPVAPVVPIDPDPNNPPIDGEEGQHDHQEASGVGAAP